MIGSPEIADWLRKAAAEVAAHRDELTALDAAIGDADHGVNLQRGFATVLARLEAGDPAQKEPSAILMETGMALVSSVGGASGPLYGTFFLRFARALANRREVSAADLVVAFQAGVEGVRQRGKAEPGEKTMVDALQPAAEALARSVESGQTLAEGIRMAAVAARQGAEATVPMVAKKGRASYLGERSRGHQDPGATSAYLIVQAAADSIGQG